MTPALTVTAALTPSVIDRWPDAILPTYATPTLTLVRGEGATVWDDTGRAYVDLVAGIAVNVLGHAHPAIVEAVSRQVATLGHVSNLYAHPGVVELAERLVALLDRPGARVFFCNSGAEANEAALKLSRLTGRSGIVSTEGGFHGRTTGSLALTGQPAKRQPFAPLVPGVTFVPYGDTAALRDAVDATTAAVFLEPVQGENGIIVPPPGYLAAAREITSERGALLVLDEVQTGIGRTGRWFAHQAAEVVPDVVTLAKGLGGGLPIGACIAAGAAADLLEPGHHASTFGGNPVACAAALAVLDTIARDGLLERTRQLGEQLSAAVTALDHPLVSGVRGAGLMRGIVLTAPVAPGVEAALRDAGYLVNAVAPTVLRLAPPLVVTEEQVAGFVRALPGALDRAGHTPAS